MQTVYNFRLPDHQLMSGVSEQPNDWPQAFRIVVASFRCATKHYALKYRVHRVIQATRGIERFGRDLHVTVTYILSIYIIYALFTSTFHVPFQISRRPRIYSKLQLSLS